MTSSVSLALVLKLMSLMQLAAMLKLTMSVSHFSLASTSCVCVCTVLTLAARDVVAGPGLQQLIAAADSAVVLRTQTGALPPPDASNGLAADVSVLLGRVIAVGPGRPL